MSIGKTSMVMRMLDPDFISSTVLCLDDTIENVSVRDILDEKHAASTGLVDDVIVMNPYMADRGPISDAKGNPKRSEEVNGKQTGDIRTENGSVQKCAQRYASEKVSHNVKCIAICEFIEIFICMKVRNTYITKERVTSITCSVSSGLFLFMQH
ncbi:hypothetical protein GJ496_002884 [Pomphorhynchus laevis]|nr:hypothetical protein GJ496_002884 [Pomphorhynchus laevis]